ncbi:MAG: penicillin-binding protein 2 [Nitrospinae bacterium]|nr:penicillin-binding protein 2 [Nitrospinota bacterium]
MRNSPSQSHRTSIQAVKSRLALVSLVLSAAGLVLVGRLVHLQIIQHDRLAAQSDKQFLRTVEITSGRGNIYDRNRNQLATNIRVESVYADPKSVAEKTATARILARVLKLNPQAVLKKLKSNRHFVWIKRKSELNAVEKLKQLDLVGVGFIAETKRYYPKRKLAASTLGFVGLDNQGLAGIEHFHHAVLKGRVQRTVLEKDARGRFLWTTANAQDLNPGKQDVVLALDEVIQFIAERELNRQVKEYRAKSGLAIVMDPFSGAVYAMASAPEFNPNNYAAYPPHIWRNDAVASAFEPGSIFKPIVAAASLEEGLAGPDDIFFCENGSYQIGKSRISEASNHQFGWLTLRNIIAKSSNIGAIKIAQRLGNRRFYDYIRKFGFGRRLGVDLPGEASGTLRSIRQWSGLSLASISFGHEISVTPIQMVSAIAAIANGGVLIRPRLTQAILKNGVLDRTFEPEALQTVLSEETSRQMINILKSVVKTGTGAKAAIPGFEVAGKTGTAQKIDPKTQTYSKTKYLASFVGFVPADAPRLVILVMIDEPQKTYWGGEVAAPVFQRIARKTLRYLHIPSSLDRVFVLDRA